MHFVLLKDGRVQMIIFDANQICIYTLVMPLLSQKLNQARKRPTFYRSWVGGNDAKEQHGKKNHAGLPQAPDCSIKCESLQEVSCWEWRGACTESRWVGHTVYLDVVKVRFQIPHSGTKFIKGFSVNY